MIESHATPPWVMSHTWIRTSFSLTIDNKCLLLSYLLQMPLSLNIDYTQDLRIFLLHALLCATFFFPYGCLVFSGVFLSSILTDIVALHIYYRCLSSWIFTTSVFLNMTSIRLLILLTHLLVNQNNLVFVYPLIYVYTYVCLLIYVCTLVFVRGMHIYVYVYANLVAALTHTCAIKSKISCRCVLYIYIYMCIYDIYIHVYIQNIYIHVYIQKYLVVVCIYIYVHVYIRIYIYIHVYIRLWLLLSLTHVLVNQENGVFVGYIYVYIYIYKYIYIHEYIYIFIYVCT